ncbi:MAG: CARDB domain-containing protein [Candidatus Electrothrix aestuarii]|uniref:CARDB domain-containing protein n=1 Tax=Candidatus Electrothrix aestuarii TaxID=3062594 RepID=A0AAU8LUQ7_9BACT|nr:CARDB domain-containing protein [Candidatus Electrothrix aestuarii]
MNKIFKIFLLFLGVTLPTTVFSAELIYSMTDVQTNAQTNVQAEALQESLASGGSAVPIQLALSSPAQIAALDEVLIPLPTGELVAGTVSKTLKGKGPSELEREAESVTVVTIANNGGALRMIEQNGSVTGMILFDNDAQKIYQASLDEGGSGVLVETDKNKYFCVDFPMQKNASLTAHVPASSMAMLDVAALTPDLSTLQNLESRPGASKTLYINFWGGVLSGTVWNDEYNSGKDIAYTPYSSDIDTSSFSATDRYNMWLAWEETSEDYAAFNINVTTSAAVYLATSAANRVQIIATTTDDFLPGAGGIAYLGAFGTANDYYRTGWVWNTSAGALGITISHESGHQMGLSHDGTLLVEYYEGHGIWGPIMGAPYDQPYVQWDQGEYIGANNKEKDLDIIKGVLGMRADDAGNATTSATALTLPVIDREGQITPNGLFSDVDVYSFAASGATSIQVKPLLGDEGEDRAANLAMNVTLKNAAGTVIASIASHDHSPLSPETNIFTYDGTLLSGTYYLTIDAVSPNTSWFTGFGEYGNGGKYRISVNSSTSTSPDLLVISPAVSNNTLTPGQSFTLSATVKNQGAGTANATALFYYRSSDATITVTDMAIGNDSIPLLTAGGVSPQNITIAAPSLEGTYWFGACAATVAGESDTSNQCSASVEVSVLAAKPDLLVISPSVSDNSLTPGQSFIATATVKNQGSATAASSTLRYYRSNDATITTSDSQLSTASVASLAAGITSTKSVSVTAPTSDGTYWIGACVDPVSNESSSTNQCSGGVQVAVTTPSQPDLLVTSSAVSDTTLTPGQSFTVSATVKNQGNATANSTTLRYYRSDDATISIGDSQFATDLVSSLLAGATSAQNASITAPTNEGTYWFGACVDTVSDESNASNQCSSGVEVTVGEQERFPWILFYPAFF